MDAARVCPKCQAPLESSENFCSACGAKVRTTLEERLARIEGQAHLKKIRTGRGWILAVSILTLIFGVVFYLKGKSELEDLIVSEERDLDRFGMSREQKDALIHPQPKLTWKDTVQKARGLVQLLLVVNLVLAAIYFGMWWWAARNPFAAALIALIVFLTMQFVNAVIDPMTLVQGWIVKIFFLVGLGNAVSAAYKYRKLQERGA